MDDDQQPVEQYNDMQYRLNINLHYLNEVSEDMVQVFSELSNTNKILLKNNHELLQVQEELKIERDRFSFLYNNAPIGYFTVNSSNQILDANQTLTKLLKMEYNKLIGTSVISFIAPDFHTIFNQKCVESLKAKKIQQCVMKMKTEHQKNFYALLEFNAIEDSNLEVRWHLALIDISDKVETEEKLRNSEYLYNTTVNSINEIIHVIDRNYNILLVNDTCKKYLQKLQLETNPVGKNLFEIWPFFNNELKEQYNKVFTQGIEVINEDKTIFNGKEFITETRKLPVFDNGEVVRVVTTINNITERKEYEQALKKNHDFLNLLIETIPNPIFYKNTEGIYTLCNQAFSNFLGIERKKIIGSTVFTLLPGDPFAQVYHQSDLNLIQSRKNQIYQSKVKHADGSYHDIIFNKSVFINSENQLDGLVGFMVDVTNLVKYDIALKESEYRFKMIADYTFDWEIYKNEKGIITYMNPRFETITGFSVSEFMEGKVIWQQFIHPQDTQLIFCIFDNSIVQKALYDIDFRIITKLGDIKYISAAAQPVFTTDGRYAGLRASLRDITSRKQKEIDAERKLIELEHKLNQINIS
jgi:PAS domain S-box-containing protein